MNGFPAFLRLAGEPVLVGDDDERARTHHTPRAAAATQDDGVLFVS